MFFFFKQKTAYEMRISDWSSDVCSSDLRETDAIVNVVRCFEDPNVIHVSGKVDPIADIEVIETELALADLQTAEKALHRHSKTARSGDKEAQRLVAALEKCIAALNQAKPVRRSEEHTSELQSLMRISYAVFRLKK